MKAEAIVLAAGLSSRAGTFKMSLELDGKTIIQRCIESMYDNCSRIIVVLGYKSENVLKSLEGYEKVEFVINENYIEGMFSSVKKGLKYLGEEKFFLTPGDYPLIRKDTFSKMLEIDGDIIIPTHKNIKGHPILMKSVLSNEVIQDTNCNSLEEFIYKKEYKTIEINDAGILRDVDTFDDYKKAWGEQITMKKFLSELK